MSNILYIISVVIINILMSSNTYGQTVQIPNNLKQAVKILNKNCPDSIRYLIKTTDEKVLNEINYPRKGDFKMIFNWTNRDNFRSRLEKYFSKRNIKYFSDEIIIIAFKKYLLTGKYNEKAILEPYQKIEKKWAAENEVRYTTDTLRGVYIPCDIDDCFKQIDSFWSDSIKTIVKSKSEEKFSSDAHFGLGMWMRNNWRLWAGSRLTKYFNSYGVYHPESISGIILDGYHRHLTGKKLNFDELIKSDKIFWAESDKQQIERNKELHQDTIEAFAEYHVGDTVSFRYRNGYVSEE